MPPRVIDPILWKSPWHSGQSSIMVWAAAPAAVTASDTKDAESEIMFWLGSELTTNAGTIKPPSTMPSRMPDSVSRGPTRLPPVNSWNSTAPWVFFFTSSLNIFMTIRGTSDCGGVNVPHL